MDRFRIVEIFAVWLLCAACLLSLFAAPAARADHSMPTLRGAPVEIVVVH